MTIPPIVVAIGAVWNLIGWVWFARAYKLYPLLFLGIPFAILAVVYGWFAVAVVEVPVATRAEWVRTGLAMVVYAQGPVLSLLAYLKSRGHNVN